MERLYIIYQEKSVLTLLGYSYQTSTFLSGRACRAVWGPGEKNPRLPDWTIFL